MTPPSGFNPSVGILGGHTSPGAVSLVMDALFQSLSRDSWWSHYENMIMMQNDIRMGFNPSVGILGGHTGHIVQY